MKHVAELDFSKLPDSISNAMIEGKIMAIDNLDQSEEQARREVEETYTYPTRTELVVIVYCSKGGARFSVNLKEVELSPMHLMVILPSCIFQVLEVTPDFKGVILLNNPDTMSLNDEAVVGISLRRFMTQNIVVTLDQQRVDQLFVLYNQLKAALQDTENPFRTQIVQRFCQIITYTACDYFLRSELVVSNKSKTRREEIFEKFILLVEQNFVKERRISFYADKLFLSPKYLSTVVREVSHKHATEWIDDYVVLEAKTLLKQGGNTIQQVSDQLNFPNQSFFGRYFKKQTGYSPKDYRNL